MLITKDLNQISEFIQSRQDAVFIYPTETFYGIGARITDHDALVKIRALKGGREAAKGMIVLVGSIEQARELAEISVEQERILRHFWPGPLSVILMAKAHVDPELVPDGKIALRCSPHEQAAAIVKAVGPITSTSANRSGEPPAASFEQVRETGLQADAMLDGGDTPGGRPSTLLDLTGEEPVCLRQGVLDMGEILAVVG